MLDRDSMFSGIKKDYYIENFGYIPTDDAIKDAMDEYAKEMCLDLLEYMAKNLVICGHWSSSDGPLFKYKGELITKESLFEMFI